MCIYESFWFDYITLLRDNGSPKENKEYFKDILDNLNLELLYNTFD